MKTFNNDSVKWDAVHGKTTTRSACCEVHDLMSENGGYVTASHEEWLRLSLVYMYHGVIFSVFHSDSVSM